MAPATLLTRHSLIHEDMKHFFDGFPSTAHPMAVLSSMVCSLSTYYPEEHDINDKDKMDVTIARLISKVRTIAAYAYKKSIGHPFVYPRNDLKYCANFLHMMFAVPSEPYEVDPEVESMADLAPGSDQACAQITSPRAIGGRKRAFCSSVNAFTPLVDVATAESTPIHPRIRFSIDDSAAFISALLAPHARYSWSVI